MYGASGKGRCSIHPYVVVCTCVQGKDGKTKLGMTFEQLAEMQDKDAKEALCRATNASKE